MDLSEIYDDETTEIDKVRVELNNQINYLTMLNVKLVQKNNEYEFIFNNIIEYLDSKVGRYGWARVLIAIMFNNNFTKYFKPKD